MATGLEALGAASAVLQVISSASDLAVACKKAYDGATTPQDDLQRHAKDMAEAVDRVHTRCQDMTRSNSKFSAPELQNIAEKCRDAAKKLEAEVQYVTSIQAKGNIAKSFHKAFKTSRHRTKIEDLEKSLSKHQRLMELELTSHLCTRIDAISLQQQTGFHKLDTDIQSLVDQLAKGHINMVNLIKQEHTMTRNIVTHETAKAEEAINSHTDTRLLEFRTDVESEATCKKFLQSLKAPRMNQRYNDVMDPRDASFNQVFASYGENDSDSEDDDDSGDDEFSETTSNSSCMSHKDEIHRSWASFSSWLQSDDVLFYIQGKPGSGKSTLIKFILDQEKTLKLVQQWNCKAIIVSYFFWKIGSHEQNSIKGLWCSLLYQRLQDQQQLIQDTLQYFKHLYLHTEYHDWSVKDLQAVWGYVANIDTRHLCIFIDGLDEICNDDGFSKLVQSIQLISKLPRTKLCVSTRPEAQIVRWLKTTSASGILLEDLTKFDMFVFVRKTLRNLSPIDNISPETFDKLRQELVYKAQGVFLWLHLATRSIIDGIENGDAEDMLLERLHVLPEDLEKLYTDMWQRLNASNAVYRETAARYFRYVIQSLDVGIFAYMSDYQMQIASTPTIFQIACSEDPKIQETLLKGRGTIELEDVLRMCNETRASIRTRCAGLIEAQPHKPDQRTSECLGDQSTFFSEAFGSVEFIHRTAHDFLTDTEAGQRILGYGTLPDSTLETRLLRGMICVVLVSQSKWNIAWHWSIIYKVLDLLVRWGSEPLPSVIEILDVIRPLYDKHKIFHEFPSMPESPLFSYFTHLEQLDEFTIARLRTESSTLLATSVLRHAWYPDSDRVSPSKRLFDALIALEANPHEYVRGDLAEGVLATPQAHGILSKANNPSVKIRYTRVQETTEEIHEYTHPPTAKYKRIVTPAPSLPISAIEHLFNVEFKGHPKETHLSYKGRTDLDIVFEYTKDLETEEVTHETMVTTLANENLGFCTYEEAGIIPPAAYLRRGRETGIDSDWLLFPLLMGRLEAAATSREEKEDLP
ncbi:hypothetical protein IL306_013654 [Fusarium sp. DS 682]|nr:hypothetical protein IL306_013654 [Fusarium sp. DS 682]